MLAACAVRAADRHRRGRLFCPTFLAKQKSGSAAGTNTRLLPTAVSYATLHLSVTRSTSALRSATVANVKGGFAANVSRRMKQCVCPAGRPGRVSARQPTYLFCFAKRRRREKATPEMAVRYADSPRPQYRKREASETRFAQTADASLSVSGTGDAAPSTGISLQQPLQKQRQRQR